MSTDNRPIAVDADGYVWRINEDGSHSMARTNPDNSPTPKPLTVYAPAATETTKKTVTIDYDEEGRVCRETTEVVVTNQEQQA